MIRDVKERRSYNATLRQEQAQMTRRRILEAARVGAPLAEVIAAPLRNRELDVASLHASLGEWMKELAERDLIGPQ